MAQMRVQGWSIRKKTIAVLVLLVTVLLGVLFGVLTHVLEAGFGALEMREARLNVERVRESFSEHAEDVCGRAVDWAAWDDTYTFARDRNQAYVESNLSHVSFAAMNLSLLVIANEEGEVIAAVEQKDATSTRTRPIAPDILTAHFSRTSPLLSHPPQPKQPTSSLLFTFGHPPLVVCSLPITKSDGTGEPQGTLTFGRYFDEHRRAAMQKALKMQLEFAAPTEPNYAALTANLPAPHLAEPILLVPKDNQVMEGLTMFADLYQRGRLVTKVTMPRTVKAEATRSVKAVLWSVAGIGLLFGLAIVMFVERTVLRRLSAISGSVNSITQSFRFTDRVSSTGSDEIATLARSINGLLSACEQVMYSLETEHQNPSEQPPAKEG